MSDLDFSSTSPMKPAAQPAAPPPPPIYNAAMAMEFFKSAGKPESFQAGAVLFAEDDKGGQGGPARLRQCHDRAAARTYLP